MKEEDFKLKLQRNVIKIMNPGKRKCELIDVLYTIFNFKRFKRS